MGVKPENGAFFGSGQTWTLPDAYNITLDVYPQNQWRADRASSAATNHALQLGATDLEYEVTRVKSPVLGRDMNPMGRGDGTYYCNGGNGSQAGNLAIRGAKPRWTDGHVRKGFGNSINNQGIGGGGGIGDDEGHVGCPKVPGDDRCWCIDCLECPSSLPRGPDSPARDCCEAIGQDCVAGGPAECMQPEVHCVYDKEQYGANCPIESKGGCPMGCDDIRFDDSCCDKQGNLYREFQPIADALKKLCDNVHNRKGWCPQLRSSIRQCILRWCNGVDRTTDGCEDTPAKIICIKRTWDPNRPAYTYPNDCRIWASPGVDPEHLFHEMIHTRWCKSAREEVEKCIKKEAGDLNIPNLNELATYACQWLCFRTTPPEDHLYEILWKYRHCCAKGNGK